jgi:midasin (ATPase involved in ribosome maturation)
MQWHDRQEALIDGCFGVSCLRHQVFAGKDGFITPRDLLRWGSRVPGTDLELAQTGYATC